MSIRQILVPFSGHASEFRALRSAMTLAKMHNAHVDAWHFMLDPAVICAPEGGKFLHPLTNRPVGVSLEEALILQEQTKHSAEKFFRKVIAKMGVERLESEAVVHDASASLHHAIGSVDHILAERARMADIIVMPKLHNAYNYSNAFSKILFSTGRPVLYVPCGKNPRALNGTTLVAWNGSVEAIHALSAALPLMEKGRNWVISVNGQVNHVPKEVELDNLVHYLRQHDIHAAASVQDKGRNVPETILQAAKNLHSGLIVMGAYGHLDSLYHSMGITDFMIRDTDIPILLAH